MKNIIYSIFIGLMIIFASCADFDEYSAEDYGSGPSVAINVSDVADSSFTLSVNPDEATSFYSYTVQLGDEAMNIDANNLYKGYVEGSNVVDASKNPSVNLTLDNLAPNTTYQIYAVAANKYGIVGEVVNSSITTSDGITPDAGNFSGSNNQITVNFSENIQRGTGNIVGKYYAQYDLENATAFEIPEENISINGSTATFEIPNPVNGLFVTISWDEGAFLDMNGNKVKEQESYLDFEEGAFKGINYRIEREAFSINDEAFISPEVGSSISDWSNFEGVIKFDNDIYRNNNRVKLGDVKVIYSNDKSSSTIKLSPDDWYVSENELRFKLPQQPASGDSINVALNEGIIYDVYGNPNSAYSSNAAKWLLFAFTKDMILGEFEFKASGDDGEFSLGTIIIEESGEEGMVNIRDLYVDGAVVKAKYNLQDGSLLVTNYSELGVVTANNGNQYGLMTYNMEDESGVDYIKFQIKTDGTIYSKSAFAIVAATTDYSEILGFWHKLPEAKFIKN